ncbi:MAG TPA: DUF6498-containing protein [bacterium]|nr:DUF6498-containing protein [bacterium]HPQ66542.1 DUF6498-containing protein [bacterium]
MTASPNRPASPRKAFLLDPSAWTLIGANLWIIYLYLVEDWSAETILAVYWLQSVIIGLFTFVTMLTVPDFDPSGITSNGRPVPPTRRAQRGMSFFFLFHYGFFHLVYALFIVGLAAREHSRLAPPGVLLGAAAIFFANHLFSFLYHRFLVREPSPPFGKLMFMPYLRIIPMHFCILAGALTDNFTLIALFTVLKTGADLGGHVIEHGVRRSRGGGGDY